MRILILGGYGVFGSRLARLLADERVSLLIAGRSREKALAFCKALPGTADRDARVVDRDGDIAAAIALDRPDLVIDCTGPFQAYGNAPYKVIEACVAAGVDYMDIADSSGFVAGVSRFEAEAKAKGVAILSGLSTCPVLTDCAARELAAGMDTVTGISGGIGPSPYSGVGLNVIRALTGYAGKPLAQGGGRALTETRLKVIAPPGHTPLDRRLFALVDTPDSAVLPALWPDLKSIWFGAGPAPVIYHRALVALAWLVRLGILPTIGFIAPLCHWWINNLRYGEHRGGMFVAATGVKDGAPITREWHLVAEGDDGPFIPSMACAALIRRQLKGYAPPPGARPATRDLEMADYQGIFAERAIVTGVRDAPAAGASLYRRILGEAFERLAPPVQALHDLAMDAVFEGRADVERGTGLLSRLAGAAVGFPATGADVPVRVEFTLKDGSEIWRRTFAGRAFSSHQSAGMGARDYLMIERFGPAAMAIALVVRDGELHLNMRGWTLFGIPMPRWLGPTTTAYEHGADGRFHFDVEIGHPFTGRIVRYRGWLEPV